MWVCVCVYVWKYLHIKGICSGKKSQISLTSPKILFMGLLHLNHCYYHQYLFHQQGMTEVLWQVCHLEFCPNISVKQNFVCFVCGISYSKYLILSRSKKIFFLSIIMGYVINQHIFSYSDYYCPLLNNFLKQLKKTV